MKKWQENRNYRRIKNENGEVIANIITVEGQDVEVSEDIFNAYAQADRRERYLLEEQSVGKVLSLERMEADDLLPTFVGAETAPSAEEELLVREQHRELAEQKQVLLLALLSLSDRDRDLINALFFDSVSTRAYAKQTDVTQKIQDSPDWEMAGIYADEGITGTSLKKRTEFKKMITACKRGHIDLIITKSLSRFARNTVDCLETVRLLKANGIGVYFEKENINTLTESSEFLITLFSGFAQAESESLSKNVAWGKAKSAEAGKVTFQYKKMLGYRKGADGQPEIVPEEAEVIKRIYHRYLDGCTLGQIKRELDEDNVPTAQGVDSWSPAIIHNILTNEKYIGDALLQKTYITDCISKKVKKNQGERAMYYVENNHPAIISREVFDQVRNEMTRRSSKRKVLQKSGKTELGKYSGKYALTELLVCGECGSPYKRVTWARNGKKRIVWRCVSRLEFGTKYCHNSPTLDESKLHSAILAAMNEFAAIRQEVCPDVLAMAEEAKQALSQAGAKLLELKKHLEAVSREQSDLLDRLLENMGDAELNAKMKALTDEKESLKAQILDTQQMEVSLEAQAARHQQMWDSIMECSAGYTEFDDEFVRQIIQKITVEDEETIRIHFRDSEMVMEQEL